MLGGTLDVLVGSILWLLVGGASVVFISVPTGWSRPWPLVAAQSLVPQLAVASIVVGAAFLLVGDMIGLVAAVVAGAVGVLVVALGIRSGRAAHPSGEVAGPTIRVAAVNLLYENDRTHEVAETLAHVNADVVVLSELTPEHAAGLAAHPVRAGYTEHIEHAAEIASGLAVWSRVPVREIRPPGTERDSLEARLTLGDREIRLLAVHPFTPVESALRWRSGLAQIVASVADDSLPLLVIGDFNASYWHAPFRKILEPGMADAHCAQGRGLSMSWPTDLVPFVRLDHALTGHGLRSIAVDDFRVPGSDHRGFVVTVG